MPHECPLAGFQEDVTLAEDNTRFQGHECLINKNQLNPMAIGRKTKGIIP